MLAQMLERYCPKNPQEATDLALMKAFLRANPDALLRSNLVGHVTASAWVTNTARDRVLMVYHRLYDSWAWTGGHADGDEDLLAVAMRECREETGLHRVRALSEAPISVECLPVEGHEKRGAYVPSHLHLNVTYLLEADDTESLRVCEAENTAVAWFTPEEALRASSEPWFVKRIYPKLNAVLKSGEF